MKADTAIIIVKTLAGLVLDLALLAVTWSLAKTGELPQAVTYGMLTLIAGGHVAQRARGGGGSGTSGGAASSGVVASLALGVAGIFGRAPAARTSIAPAALCLLLAASSCTPAQRRAVVPILLDVAEAALRETAKRVCVDDDTFTECKKKCDEAGPAP